MPLTVLSDSAKSHLKQERDRLVQDRQAIIQSVVATATMEVDQVLAHLEGLLNIGAIDASPSAAAAAPQSVSTPSTSPTRSTASPSPRMTRKEARGDAKGSGKAAASQVKPFDSKRLKAQFAGQTPQAVILQVFQDSPEQAFSQDDLINRLYDEFPQKDLMRARRSVSLTLTWSTRRGELVRVQEEPALYQLAAK